MAGDAHQDCHNVDQDADVDSHDAVSPLVPCTHGHEMQDYIRLGTYQAQPCTIS